jgi:hypothetical protein
VVGWMDGWMDGWMRVNPNLRESLEQSKKAKKSFFVFLTKMTRLLMWGPIIFYDLT